MQTRTTRASDAAMDADGPTPPPGVVRALIAAVRAGWSLRRVHLDPAAPSILEGRYYADSDLTREMLDMVTRLMQALAGTRGVDQQEAAIDALRTAYRHTAPPSQLVTAAHVFDLLDPPRT